MAQEPGLPPELQERLQQLQSLGAQLQAVSQQRLQHEAMKGELDQAAEALESLDDDAPVYRNLGSLLVKDSGKKDALARLRDEAETLEVRLKRLRSQEEEMKKNMQSLQQALQAQFASRTGTS